MGLLKCPDCGKEFSDRIDACPNCACPKSAIMEELAAKKETIVKEEPKVVPSEYSLSFVGEKTSNNYGDFHIRGEDVIYRPPVVKPGEDPELEKTYRLAKSTMESAITEFAYTGAAKLFQSIVGYKDSDKLAIECFEKAEAKKLERERGIYYTPPESEKKTQSNQPLKKDSKDKNGLKLLITVFIVFFVFSVLSIFVVTALLINGIQVPVVFLFLIGLSFDSFSHLILPMSVAAKGKVLSKSRLWLFAFAGGLMGFIACAMLSENFRGLSGIINSSFWTIIGFLILKKGCYKKPVVSYDSNQLKNDKDDTLYCSICGSILPKDCVYCKECGTKITSSTSRIVK